MRKALRLALPRRTICSMIRHIFWAAALIIAFSVGYWMGKDGPPVASRREAASSVAFPEEAQQRQATSTRNSDPGVPVQPGRDLHPGSPSLSRSLSPHDEKEPDHKSEEVLKNVRVYNLNDSFEREEYAASLREGGISEEEIRNILRGSQENDESERPSPGSE